jgi:tRNA U34 5-carboxymethylaminomethyl modifying GTPase MnmE/TrmE
MEIKLNLTSEQMLEAYSHLNAMQNNILVIEKRDISQLKNMDARLHDSGVPSFVHETAIAFSTLQSIKQAIKLKLSTEQLNKDDLANTNTNYVNKIANVKKALTELHLHKFNCMECEFDYERLQSVIDSL